MFCFNKNCQNYQAYLDQCSSFVHSIALPQNTFEDKPLIFGKNNTIKGEEISHEMHTREFDIHKEGTYDITLEICPLPDKVRNNKNFIKVQDKTDLNNNYTIYFTISPSKVLNKIIVSCVMELKENSVIQIYHSKNRKINLSQIVIAKRLY